MHSVRRTLNHGSGGGVEYHVKTDKIRVMLTMCRGGSISMEVQYCT